MNNFKYFSKILTFFSWKKISSLEIEGNLTINTKYFNKISNIFYDQANALKKVIIY